MVFNGMWSRNMAGLCSKTPVDDDDHLMATARVGSRG